MSIFNSDKKREYVRFENGKRVKLNSEEIKKNVAEPIISSKLNNEELNNDSEVDFSVYGNPADFDETGMMLPSPPGRENEDNLEEGKIDGENSDSKFNKITKSKLFKIGITVLIIIVLFFAMYKAYSLILNKDNPISPLKTSNNDIGKDSKTPAKDAVNNSANTVNLETPVISSKDSPVKVCVVTANYIDILYVGETKKEVDVISGYLGNKVSKASLVSSLEMSLSRKEDYYFNILQKAKTIYISQNIEGFYDATENRILNSMSFTKNILELVKNNGGRDKVSDETLMFMERESKYTMMQTNELITIMIKKNISYTIKSDTNEIVYNLN